MTGIKRLLNKSRRRLLADHMNTEKFNELIEKYQRGEITEEQRALLDQWFESLGHRKSARWTPDQVNALGNRIREEIGVGPSLQRSFGRWIPYAAAILLSLAVGAGYYYLSTPAGTPPPATASAIQDVQPGGNRATLTLSNGQTIDLSSEQTGVVIGNEITYADGSAVTETLHAQLDASIPLSLSTPRGGTYQVTLPDGTNVWLNSATTLRYPSRFDKPERTVELEGEAYFEVASTLPKPRPFLVKTREQTVEVLGTHFCVTAYVDESETKTTLVEGAVKVLNLKANKSDLLKPGEQSIISDAGTEIRMVNTETVIAWKNGIFFFEETPFEQMMKQIDRWYDIEVRYHGPVPNERFSGKMGKNVNLQVFVDFLKDSGVRSRIQGRQLIIGE